MRRCHFITLCLLLALPLTATGKRQAEPDESQVVAPEFKNLSRRQKRVYKKSLKDYHEDAIRRGFDCAASLLEHDWDGSETSDGQDSHVKGMRTFYKIGVQFVRAARGEGEFSKIRDYAKRCEGWKQEFKVKGAKRKSRTHDNLEDSRNYIWQEYKSQKLLQIYDLGTTPYANCETTFSFSFDIKIIGGFGFGGVRYTCETPLGRRYHLTGPSVAGGMGLGVDVKAGRSSGQAKFKFQIPLEQLIDRRTQILSTFTDQLATHFNLPGENPEMSDYPNRKLPEWGQMIGKEGLVRTKARPNFEPLYELLNMPFAKKIFMSRQMARTKLQELKARR